VRVDGSNKINLRKEVRKYLGAGQGMRFTTNGEVALTVASGGTGRCGRNQHSKESSSTPLVKKRDIDLVTES